MAVGLLSDRVWLDTSKTQGELPKSSLLGGEDFNPEDEQAVLEVEGVHPPVMIMMTMVEVGAQEAAVGGPQAVEEVADEPPGRIRMPPQSQNDPVQRKSQKS